MLTYQLCTVIVALVLPAAALKAQCTVIVAPGGNDGNAGTVSAPLATPAIAVQRANPGGAVCLRAGIYPLNAGLIIDKSLIVQSYPGEWAVLTADNTGASPVDNVVFVGGNDVTIQDIEISGGSFYGIHINSFFLGFPPANTRVVRVKIHHSGYTGIKAYQGDNVQVINSEIYAIGTRISGGSGIDILAAIPSATNPSGQGATVVGNYVHDLPYTGIVLKAGTVRGLIESNRVERIAGGGIYAGGESDLQYFRNGATSECIDCIVRNNLVVGTDALGITCWGAQGAQILNNTVVNAAASSQAGFYAVADSSGYTCNNSVLQNNVFVSSGVRPMIHSLVSAPSVSSDYNVYYSLGGYYGFWIETPALTAYTGSLAAWQSATGQDLHSVAGQNPRLDSANSYMPMPGSPLIDHGTTLAKVPTDYSGVSRPQGIAYDIGAFEIAPTPALLSSIAGSGQRTPVGNTFPLPLIARVTDARGAGISGVRVTFSAPSADGPGATFNGSYAASVTTDTAGVATSPPVTANTSAGTYAARVSAGSLPTLSYLLTNNPVAVPTATLIAGGTARLSALTLIISGSVTSSGIPVTGGSLQFFVNGNSMATVPVNNGRISWAMPIPAGSIVGAHFSVYAVFSGASSWAPSRSATVSVDIR